MKPCNGWNWLVLLIIAIQGSQALARAVEITPGIMYDAGTSLAAPDLGIEFSVPPGWRALLPQGTEVMVMAPDSADARMLLTAVPSSTEASLRQRMEQSQPLDVNSRLVPVGDTVKKGKYFHQRYTLEGLNPQKLAAQAYAVLGDNGTAFIAILLEPRDREQYTMLTRDLVASIRFSTPAQNSTYIAAAENVDWQKTLTGRTLKYMQTSAGMSVTRTLNLCSDHTFSYRDSDNYASSDAMVNFSSTTRNDQNGRWRIDGNRLTLLWNDGTESRHVLSRRYVEDWDEWGTFVDDERWFSARNKACY